MNIKAFLKWGTPFLSILILRLHTFVSTHVGKKTASTQRAVRLKKSFLHLKNSISPSFTKPSPAP
jgi:hypothetical protein